MKNQTYIKHFQSENRARNFMAMKNKTSINEIFCFVDGPENNYSVVDLRTAVELNISYKCSLK